jgi:hypothetical protein
MRAHLSRNRSTKELVLAIRPNRSPCKSTSNIHSGPAAGLKWEHNLYPPEELCTRPDRDQRRWEFLVGREQAEFLRLLASGQEEEGQEAQRLSHPTPPRKGAQAARPCMQSTKWHLCVFKDSWEKEYLSSFKGINSQIFVITHDAAFLHRPHRSRLRHGEWW